MGKFIPFIAVIYSLFLTSLSSQETEDVPVNEAPSAEEVSEVKSVYVVPVQGAVVSATGFIVKRALKEAVANNVDAVVLDMDTPGGALDVTLEIMEALDRFEGDTMTFINEEAISAGAYITVATDYIYFHPKGQIGAAEAVSGTGEEIPEAMKRKLQSYLNAKIRIFTESHRYRGEVMRAMADPAYELVIDEKVLKTEDELLSLTALESIETYGDPPEPLLADGIAPTLEEILIDRYGEGGYEIKDFGTNWSENLAMGLQSIVPVLMGLGLLLIFIEFKTPNFGLIGGIGITLIILVFASNYLAGLAGHEAILMFVIGVVLIGLEIFIFPGVIIAGFLGIAMILTSLVWSLADVWPQPGGGGWDFTGVWPTMVVAMRTVILSTLGSVLALALIWTLLPKRSFASRLVHSDSLGAPSKVVTQGAIRPSTSDVLPDQGTEGIVTADMHPLGKVEIAGKSYEAMVQLGSASKGTRVKVVGYRQFSLLVEAISEDV
jgi:membrane-bound serine protease (ClpP class)